MKIFILFVLFTGVSHAQPNLKVMNPDVGANFLFEASKSTSKTNDGFSMREAEFSFKSDVDPYFKANMIFSVEKEDSGEYAIDPEEVYADTTFIPNLTLRVGKFYGFFGKHNLLHTHIFPFITAPLINQALLGDEGLNKAGVSASWLLPTNFFSELTVQSFDHYRVLAHARTLFELNDDSTVELGTSAMNRWAYGVDFTFKHRPTQVGMGRRFVLAGEWMSGSLDGFTTSPNEDGTPTQGLNVYTQYEFLSKTFAQYRYDRIVSNKQNRHGVVLGYTPSEFSVVRVQYDQTRSEGSDVEHRVVAQVNFTIGFHPSHSY